VAISDPEIIAELTGGGARVEDYFLIGYDICAVNPDGLLSSPLIEDMPGEKPGEMHFAVLDFLRRHGANEYKSYEDYLAARDLA
jgi:hypothetical protein